MAGSAKKKVTYRKPKEGWMLAHGSFEVFWKRDNRNRFFADMVRVDGATFYYCGTKKLSKRGEVRNATD